MSKPMLSAFFFLFISRCRLAVFTAALIVAQLAPVLGQEQQRTGNIVEYFGKEKAAEISEGELLHVFREGKVLGRPRSFGGSGGTSTPVDDVFAKFLFGHPTGVDADRAIDVDYRGRPIEWEAITAGDTSTFEGRQLRSGVLYLTYESDSEQTVLLDASGPTRLLIDGLPHEGDHYDFGYFLIPLQLKAGKHEFVMQGGRFGRMRARLIKPSATVRFTTRDMTLPDIRLEDREELLGAIRVINAESTDLVSAKIRCSHGDVVSETPVGPVAPLLVRKVPFAIPAVEVSEDDKSVEFDVQLLDGTGEVLASETIELNVRSKHKHHKRTFLSDIDGSVQYYSVAPSTNPDLENPALFLSVHGASVEATNQANAYKQKDWGYLIAPTNRRPFGFAWEDWGRLDALEVLADAERIYQTDPSRTYLTGHSMGGHGTWYLGATYPDRFAAIAPCAGYPDLLGYRGGFMSRFNQIPEEMRRRFGITEQMINRMKVMSESKSVFDEIVNRAGNPSRTLKLIQNYSQLGVYVLHGENDTVVPTALARDMRKRLGEFHSDFVYYEYPNGSHWYGNHSVDWGPIFEFFQDRTIESANELEEFTFATASPGVSAKSHCLTIVQQEVPFEVSSVDFSKDEEAVEITTDNVRVLSIDQEAMGLTEDQTVKVDEQLIEAARDVPVWHLVRSEDKWAQMDAAPSAKEKGPHRNGGFKDAFRNQFVLVYGTQGSEAENQWYQNRARFDAEKFWYRGNGNVEMIADTNFAAGDYTDRNVIVYGNRDNNSVWETLLKDCPIQVSNDEITFGEQRLTGSNWGTYFVYPRSDSDVASVGVVTATGEDGMKAAYANHYLVNGTCFPDVMIFDDTLLTRGIRGLKCAGFFGNSWDIDSGDFVWR